MPLIGGFGRYRIFVRCLKASLVATRQQMIARVILPQRENPWDLMFKCVGPEGPQKVRATPCHPESMAEVSQD